MAVFHCRWKRVLCCLCASCSCVLLVLIYVLVTVFTAVNKHMMGNVQSGTRVLVSQSVKKPPEPPYLMKKPVSELPTYFIAPGAIKTNGYSATPTVFWDKKYEHAFWNQLQKAVDLNFMDILHPVSSQLEPGPPGAMFLSHSLSEHRSTGHSLFSLPERLQSYVSSQRQFPVLLQPRGQCGDGDSPDRAPLLLLAIRTSEQDYRRRQLIRQSWGTAGWVRAQGNADGRGAYVSRVFLIGTDSSELQSETFELLHLENQHYRDILQWDIRDTPLNGTVKQLLFWSWFSDFCQHTSFVFETNDEVFVNTRALVSLLLDQLDRGHLEDFMLGHVVYGGKPDRSSSSQEFIPESFYRGWYPSYARGAGRMSSALLLRRLLHVSHRVHLFPVEQVYVGMCLFRLNLSPTHHPAFLPSDWTKEWEEKPCEIHKAVLLQTHSTEHMLQLWLSLSPLCANITVDPIPENKTPVTARERPHHVF